MRHVWHFVYLVTKPLLMAFVNKSQRSRAVIINGSKILVIQNRLGDGKWVLPGGGLHKKESTTDGTIREVREETGLILEPSQLESVGSETATFGWATFECHYFLVQLAEPKATRKQWLEISDIAWMEITSLDASNSGPEVLRGLALSSH